MFSLCSKRLVSKSRVLRKCYSTAVETARKDSSEEYQDKEIQRYDRLTNIVKRTRARKPQREPFVKNLLAGIFDKEILTFPELDLSEFRNLEKEVEQLSQVLHQKHMVNVDSIGDKKFRQNLSDHRAIGLQASQFLDGREATPLELVAYLDTLSEHKLRSSIVNNEMLGVQTLNKFASDDSKKKYLHAVMKGEYVTAFALNDNDTTDLSRMSTTADLSKDGKTYILNGKKSFVVNGQSAEVLIVFAVTESALLDNERVNQISAFVVEKSSRGVSWEKLDSAGIEIADITFENVQVPAENLLGRLHGAEHILKGILTDFRLSCGPPCNAISKQLITNLYKHFVALNRPEYNFLSTDAVLSVLGESVLDLYASESIVYLTAGLQDWYENQDVDVESALSKIYCSEAAMRISNTCLNMVGLPATLKDHWARKGHNNLLDYLTVCETNESLRLYLALASLQHAGISTANRIKKIRNPFYHASFMLKRVFTSRHQYSDNPKLDLELYDSLHPTLKSSAKQLEYCCKRLQFATELFFANNGIECVNKHSKLRNLANIMLDCYAMTAVLARASRSYCIGLQFAEYELYMATVFCSKAEERVRSNVANIVAENFEINDMHYIAVGKRLVDRKGLFLTSPLTRFF